jgi:hypothetical protein
MKIGRKVLVIAVATSVLTILLFLWNKSSIPIDTITWSTPKPFSAPITNMTCDLDDDGNEEIVIVDNDCWHLELRDKQWQVERLPLEQGEKILPISFKRFLLIKTDKGDLLILRKRDNRWEKRKLAEKLANKLVAPPVLWDFDGDGEKDDLFILSREILLWFKVKDTVSLQDVLNLPKLDSALWGNSSVCIRVNNIEVTVFSWSGKLQCMKGRWECEWADMNGDGKADLVMVGEQQVSALLTGQEPKNFVKGKEPDSVTLKKPTQERLPPATTYLPAEISVWKLFDLDDDGRHEVIGVDRMGYIHRLWLENNQWQRERTPFTVKGVPFAIMRVGKQNWLLFSYSEFLRPNMVLNAVWLSKSGWIRKTWQLWGDKEGSLVLWYDWNDGRFSLLLSKKTFLWRLIRSLDELLSQVSIDLSLPIQNETTQTRTWNWDEQKQTWKLTETWEGHAEPIDLNGDGQEERLLYSERWIKLAVYGGRFWKRWRVVSLLRDYCMVTTLRQTYGTWIIAIEANCRTVHAWTLRK